MSFQTGYDKYLNGLPPSRIDADEREGWQAAKRDLPPHMLSPGAKALRFGDANHSHEAGQKLREQDLVERLQQGLPMGAADRRDARRILRERAAS